MPFGANQIVALNERLGAHERCQGGLFSSLIDKYPTELVFESDPGLTAVSFFVKPNRTDSYCCLTWIFLFHTIGANPGF